MSNKPPIEVPQGAIRLNTDSQRLEFFAQDRWYEIATNVPTLDGGARGLIGGGRDKTALNFITIPTAGNGTDFGDFSTDDIEGGAFASRTRSVGFGKVQHTNIMEFVTFSSTGNATDFGDMVVLRRSAQSCSNQTRGVMMGGIIPGTPNTDAIDFSTIATTGNALDFGNLATVSGNASGNAGSPTRGLCLGGTPSATGAAQFITIATTGDASTFGDLNESQGNRGSCSNSIRAIHTHEQVIDFLTIATTGNSTHFGELGNDYAYKAACTSKTRAVWGGGLVSPGGSNMMMYIEIMTGGDSVDFGDMDDNYYVNVASSNDHGGL